MQGATIKTDEETGKIIIARIMHGGAADRSGLIHVGDEVIEVNGINVEGKTPNDVLTILVSKLHLKKTYKRKTKMIEKVLTEFISVSVSFGTIIELQVTVIFFSTFSIFSSFFFFFSKTQKEQLLSN